MSENKTESQKQDKSQTGFTAVFFTGNSISCPFKGSTDLISRIEILDIGDETDMSPISIIYTFISDSFL